MKFELVLKFKQHEHDAWAVHRQTIVPADRYEYVLGQFKDYAKSVCDRVDIYDVVLLVNKLDDNGDFLEVVQ